MQKIQTLHSENSLPIDLHSVEVCDIRGLNGCIFTDIEEGENLLLVVRKHWIVIVQSLFLVLVLVGLCIGVFFIGQFASVPTSLSFATSLGIALFGLQYIFIEWVNNELDILLLTDRRIIAYEQLKFLDRKFAQTTIDLVQEVNATTVGLLGNILQYGDLTIKTASDSGNTNSDFYLVKVKEPLETSRIIHAYIDKYRHDLDKDKPRTVGATK